MRTFQAIFPNQPWRSQSFPVRGICRYDVLNPCWDNRRSDVPGKHWSGLGNACKPCTEAARRASAKANT